MPRYARMLIEGLQEREHEVESWAPVALFHRFGWGNFSRKWLGYVDQFLVFPLYASRRIRSEPSTTLYVFSDQALGPWVPLVAHLPHVIHCHDFLAQRSAQDEFPMNPTSRTGKVYQKFIRRGYSRGRNFISVSHKTRLDLHRFLAKKPGKSVVIHNGLNQDFTPSADRESVKAAMALATGINLENGFLLHVGSNVWYKNRLGVLEIYEQWRQLQTDSVMPLLMIGEAPSKDLQDHHSLMKFRKDVHFLPDVEDASLRLAYQSASVLLFPSLAEGFGWPIAEAMASGCPVITTGEAPMTEVAGDSAFFIDKRPIDEVNANKWAQDASVVLEKVVFLVDSTRTEVVARGIRNAARFNSHVALDRIESIYLSILGADRRERGDEGTSDC